MLENKIRKEVCAANKKLPEMGLVMFTWGNVSAINRESGLVAIKPSGVEYSELSAENMVVLNLDGEVVEGDLNPSSDTKAHLELYKHFKGIKAVAHTHSTYATAFAQANTPIRHLGTTHADYFYGNVPLVPELRDVEIARDYEKNTGLSIVRHFEEEEINPLSIPACLCSRHGPFTWGDSAKSAVENIAVLEEISKMNQLSLSINSKIGPMKQSILDKHYLRKNGKDSYYGQK